MKIEYLQQALEGTEYTAEYVLAGLERGDFFLFSNEKALAVMEFIQSPRHKTAHVWAAGGEKNAGLAPYLELVPIMEEFAIRSGCDSGGGTGRRGWVRAMKRLGYQAAEPAIEKRFS